MSVSVFIFYFLKFLTYSGIWDLKYLLSFLYIDFSPLVKWKDIKEEKVENYIVFWIFLVIFLII